MTGYERTQKYRVAHPERYEGEKRRNAARQRALVLLARRYPDDFRDLYEQELAISDLTARARS